MSSAEFLDTVWSLGLDLAAFAVCVVAFCVAFAVLVKSLRWLADNLD